MMRSIGRGGVASAIFAALLFYTQPQTARAQTNVDSVTLNVDWPTALTDRSTTKLSQTMQAFALENVSSLADVKLPVLLADTPIVTAKPVFRSQSTAYAASYVLEGSKLSVLGTSIILVQTQEKRAMAQAQAPSNSTRQFDPGEDGTDLSFFKYGVSYVLRLSCAKSNDDRCAKPIFLNDVADKLVVVGGQK